MSSSQPTGSLPPGPGYGPGPGWGSHSSGHHGCRCDSCRVKDCSCQCCDGKNKCAAAHHCMCHCTSMKESPSGKSKCGSCGRHEWWKQERFQLKVCPSFIMRLLFILF